MVHMVPIMYWRSCDQLAFNTLLRHHRFRQLHYECLQRRQVLDLHVADDGERQTRPAVSTQGFSGKKCR
jgi:hypothetical protein